MSNTPKDQFSADDEDDLIRAEFESMVAGLSLDESAPTTYLDELDARAKFINPEGFNEPNPERIGLKKFLKSAKDSIVRWRKGQSKDDDGVEL